MNFVSNAHIYFFIMELKERTDGSFLCDLCSVLVWQTWEWTPNPTCLRVYISTGSSGISESSGPTFTIGCLEHRYSSERLSSNSCSQALVSFNLQYPFSQWSMNQTLRNSSCISLLALLFPPCEPACAVYTCASERVKRKETWGFTSTQTIGTYMGRGSWGVGNFYI